MNKRSLCERCHYPINTCVCAHIKTVSHKSNIIILQHPTETKNSKNTARLLKLISNQCEILVGENSQDFSELQQQTAKFPEQYALLFPSEHAIEPNQLASQTSALITNFIVIDGTWSKAKKLIHLNPWLLALPQIKLAAHLQSKYQIRKSNFEHGLSTIEAVAHLLHEYESTSLNPFYEALNGLKANFTKHLPENVKHRYKQ